MYERTLWLRKIYEPFSELSMLTASSPLRTNGGLLAKGWPGWPFFRVRHIWNIHLGC